MSQSAVARIRHLAGRVKNKAAEVVHERTAASATPAAGEPGVPDVTVVLPVYNALPYLTELLDSLAKQDIGYDRYEIIAVDDGSSDRSGVVLDDYAARLPNMTVVHQANSGWAGAPRNRALERARGRYVFFADGDDVLGVQTLRRLVVFADKKKADVVIPRVVGLGGRNVERGAFARTVVDADLAKALTSLSPQKLIRRDLIEDNGLRFSEEKVRLEDGMFVVAAYLKAGRVSILSDYDYYFLRRRDDGQNISHSGLVPAEYTRSVAHITRQLMDSDLPRSEAERLALVMYRRKVLKIYVPSRWRGYKVEKQREWVAAHAGYIAEFITPEMEQRLREPFRGRSRALRTGDLSAINAWADREDALSIVPTLVGVAFTESGGLDVQVDFGRPLACEVRLRLLERGDGVAGETVFTELDDQHRWAAEVLADTLTAHRGTVLEGFVVPFLDSTEAESIRLAVPSAAALPGAREGMRCYATRSGNFAIELARA